MTIRGGTARIGWWFIAFTMMLVALGCREAPTRIVVRVDSLDLREFRDLLRVDVTAQLEGEGRQFPNTTREIHLVDSGYRLPGEVLVTPLDATDARRVILRVVATLTRGRATITQEFVTSFERERTKVIYFRLSELCAGVDCGVGRTCVPEGLVAACADRERPIVGEYPAGAPDALMWADAVPADVRDGESGDADVGDVADAPTEAATDVDATLDRAGDLPDAEDVRAEVSDGSGPGDGGAVGPVFGLRCDVPGVLGRYPRHCEELRCTDPDAGTDVYVIDPAENAARCADAGADGDLTVGDSAVVCPFRAYCDMERDEGGWTMISAGTNGNSPADRPGEVLVPDLAPPLRFHAWLSDARLSALMDSFGRGTHRLFRRGTHEYRLFIEDSDPTPAAGRIHWYTRSTSVRCATSYDAVLDDRMSEVTDFAPSGVASIMEARGPWGFLTSTPGGPGADTLDNPCAFVLTGGAHPGLANTWIRGGIGGSKPLSPRCPPGLTLCSTGRACVDLARDPTHCGACTGSGTLCPMGRPCVDAVCRSDRCAAGRGDCDANAANGCEEDLLTSGGHCGGCGTMCPAGSICSAGACSPSTRQRSCAATSPPGCGLVSVARSSGTVSIGVEDDCNVGTSSRDRCALHASPAVAGVSVGDLSVDAYEVTVGRFRAFWQARLTDGGGGVRRTPQPYPARRSVGWEEYPGLWYVGSAPVPSTDDPRCNWSNDPAAPSREGHPINCVDWFTALEFCAWDGGRLPTESEWEYLARLRRDGAAASLPAPRVYPWGDDAPRQSCDATARARWLGDACPLEDGARTHRVGSYADAGGIHDLAGNVAEWTIDVFNSVDATFLGGFARATYWAQGGFFAHEATEHAASAPRVVRGGSWRDTRPAVLRAASRSLASYRSRLSTIGFRCVRSVSPPGGM